MKNRPDVDSTHADAGRFQELIESVLAGGCRKWTQPSDMKLHV